MEDRIEFWLGESVIANVVSSFAPDRGDLVNIRKQTYKVIGRTFTVDYAGERGQHVVCVINLSATGDEAQQGEG